MNAKDTGGSAWQPIESAPRSAEEIAALYDDGIGSTVLIGRVSEPFGHGVIPGAVAECALVGGKWLYPLPPDMRRLTQREYGELAGATHWMPLPEPPPAARKEES